MLQRQLWASAILKNYCEEAARLDTMTSTCNGSAFVSFLAESNGRKRSLCALTLRRVQLGPQDGGLSSMSVVYIYEALFF
jgi:hypothetical protein